MCIRDSDVPADAGGEMAARFRFTAEPMGAQRSTTGIAASGEVEDYVLGAIGNYTFNDVNENGLQDTADTALAGVIVNLLDNTGSPVLDAAGNPITTVSDSVGSYEFHGLPDGQYQIQFIAPAGLQLTSQNGANNGTDSDADPITCLLYTSPSPRDATLSRMPSSA